MTAIAVANNMITHRTRSRAVNSVWIVLLGLLGAISGYFEAVRFHRAVIGVTIVGCTWGAFIGSVIYFELVRLRLPLRRWISMGLGLVSGCVSGAALGWSAPVTVVVTGVAILLGAVGEKWAKYVSVLP
jgi:hypothetical protein